MNLMRLVLHAALAVPYNLRRMAGRGPFGPGAATYVAQPAADGGNALKRALIRHYVRQYSNSSCSVASVVSVVNALRSLNDRRHRPIGQLEILDAVDTADWKARMSPSGHRGRRGLPLSLLGEVVRSALDIYQIPYRRIDTVAADAHPGRSRDLKAVLRRRLEAFEGPGSGLIIAHFDQGAFVRALNIPHISPVGAFDADSDKVTVLDVDPDQPGPYSVSLDTFYRGLSSNFHHILRPFGYFGGGYVWVGITGATLTRSKLRGES